MKHVGIAAVTAEGAALVYRKICSIASSQLGGHRHPEISLHSFSFSEHVNAGEKPHDKWAQLIRDSASKLHASGADFMICPSNTPHAVYEHVVRDLPLPWLHIAEAVRKQSERSGFHRLLLLGTHFTCNSTVYDDYCRRSGISVVRPTLQQISHMHQLITNELVTGEVSMASRDFFSNLIRDQSKSGVDAVILGCTELPLAISPASSDLPLVDSTVELAKAAVEYAINS